MIDVFVGYAQRKLNISKARSWLERPSADRDTVMMACNINPDWFDDRIGRLQALWAAIDRGEIDARKLGSGQRQVHS